MFALSTSPAAADDNRNHAGADTDPNGVTVTAGTGGAQGGVQPSGRAKNAGAPGSCSYKQLSPVEAGVLNRPGQEAGSWWVRDCQDADALVTYFVPASQSPAADPKVLAQSAVSRLQLPPPAIGLSPPTRELLVNLPTWLWINGPWQPVSATAAAGAVSSTATAKPARVVWTFGNGESLTCIGPGKPFDNTTTDCSYAYKHSSAGQPGNQYTVTATVYYEVTWTATGAPGGGNLGEVASPPSTTWVSVGEVQAINGQP